LHQVGHPVSEIVQSSVRFKSTACLFARPGTVHIFINELILFIFPSKTWKGKNFSWYEKTWMGAAAITNSEYPKEVEVPIPQWYWFNTGDKIPQDYKGWNPEHELSEYHTYWHAYRGCALLYLSGEIRATACHPVYPSLCEVVKSLA
jgi:hypothetical protein